MHITSFYQNMTRSDLAALINFPPTALEIRMTEKCAYMLLKDIRAMIVDAGPLHLKV